MDSQCSLAGFAAFCAAAFFVHRLHRRLVWLGPEGVIVEEGLFGRQTLAWAEVKKVSVSPGRDGVPRGDGRRYRPSQHGRPIAGYRPVFSAVARLGGRARAARLGPNRTRRRHPYCCCAFHCVLSTKVKPPPGMRPGGGFLVRCDLVPIAANRLLVRGRRRWVLILRRRSQRRSFAWSPFPAECDLRR